MSQVALFLLGPPRIEREGEPVEVDTRKAIALASFLVVSGESHARDDLAALFWPLSDQTRARSALRRTLSSLRKAVGEEHITADGECLALRLGASLWVDVDQFLVLLAKCRTHGHPVEDVCPACLSPLSQAVDVYQADFMSGFTLRDSPSFDEWQTFQTESLRLDLASALERLVRYHCERRQFEAATAYARRWTALDPLHDVPHYLLMQIYAWAGQRSAALRQYKEYVEILAQELGAPPEAEITRLYRAIRENQELPLPSRSTAVPFHNLPLQATPFVGREDELREVDELLNRESCRLLTLYGPGGIGKTRLALELAGQRIGSFANGIYFVPLAHLSSSDLMVPAIAESLSFSFRGRLTPREQLLNTLGEKELLIVLDNFEHLLDDKGTGLLVEMLSRAPRVKLLVTSRERLNLRWEWPVEVTGLRFPQNGLDPTLEAYSAVKLFLQSARRAYPGFSLSKSERPNVARICRSLEGMPLGIELAAAWVEVSSCQEIAAQIDKNLDFLTTSRRDVPERHRSLHAAFEHSWRLLSAEQKEVLSKLSVFRSGFRQEAAAQVAGASLLHLSALMHKSFLRRSHTGRYEILEVLRQYAVDRLQASPTMQNATQDRHGVYYATFLKEREADLKGATPQQALDEIGAEIDNVRAAWRWAVTQHRWEQIENSLDSLHRFFNVRSWFTEGEELFRRTAEALADGKGAETDGLSARLLTRQGWFRLKLARFEEGHATLQTSLENLRRLDLPEETALALNHLGFATAILGDLEKAAELFLESITIFDRLQDPIGKASSLNNIGIVAMIQQRYEDARLLLQESLAIREEIGYLKGMVDNLTNLGLVAEALGEYDAAKASLLQCLGICVEIDDRWATANSLCSLGFVLRVLGEHFAARRCFDEALELAADWQSIDLILESLVGIATLLAEEGKGEEATEICACVLGHAAVSGQAKERAEELLTKLQSQLPAEAFAAAQQRGRENEVYAYARANSGRRQRVG